ncbi:MAG: hypothetical protein ACI9CA_000933 [Natronomonas sp.]|jgi:hypothetical protein
MTPDPLHDIVISETARKKRDRYLRPDQLRRTLRNGSGSVYRRSSPNHDGLYDESRFILRGTFHGKDLDIVFVVERTTITVVTQMGQHATTMQGRFYDEVGRTAADAVAWVRVE